MTTYQEQRKALLRAADDVVQKARLEGRDMTAAETKSIQEKVDEIDAVDQKIAKVAADAAVLKSLSAAGLALNGDGLAYYGEQVGGFLRLGKAAPLAGVLAKQVGQYAGVDTVGRKSLTTGATVTTVTVDAEPVALGMPAGSILDVLPAHVRAVPTYVYLRQSTRTNAAAVVAVGEVKPTSIYTLAPVSATLSVVAHMSEAQDKYLLGDTPMLADFLRSELTYGLRAAVEAKVLTDLAATSGIQTQGFSVDTLQTTRSAVTKLELVGSTPGYWVLAPADWAAIELTRASGSGEFLMESAGVPVDRAARRLWSIPVVVSTSATAGVGWLVAGDAAELSTDGLVAMDWGSPGDLFTRNQVQARLEGRYNLDVKRPFGVVKLTAVTGP